MGGHIPVIIYLAMFEFFCLGYLNLQLHKGFELDFYMLIF